MIRSRWRLAAILKISNGHTSATALPIHFVFDSVVGFWGTADRMALLPVDSHPWRPNAILDQFKMVVYPSWIWGKIWAGPRAFFISNSVVWGTWIHWENFDRKKGSFYLAWTWLINRVSGKNGINSILGIHNFRHNFVIFDVNHPDTSALFAVIYFVSSTYFYKVFCTSMVTSSQRSLFSQKVTEVVF